MTTIRLLAWLVSVSSTILSAMPAASAQGSAREAVAPAPAEDYRSAVGRVDAGTLRVRLTALEVPWQPWGADGPTIRAHAFAADDSSPRVPGPLIRVTAGMPVHVSLRNTLARPLVVRGLHDRGRTGPGPAVVASFTEAVVVKPGEEADVRFTPRVPGTFLYFGRAPAPGDRVPPNFFGGDRADGPFVGVLVVDPPDGVPARGERLFVITQWMDGDIRASFDPDFRMLINGRSWPHTERLAYAEGAMVRWRVINATGIAHPMHLHGFFFDVIARGTQRDETVFPAAERRSVVTETLDVGESMQMTWVAETPGNWIFHCHLMRHMSHLQHAPAPETSAAPHVSMDGDALLRLGGLVLGLTVTPRAAATTGEPPRRRLHLFTATRPGAFGDAPAHGFVLQDGSTPPEADDVRVPGSPIVLTRGQPAEVVVHNRLDFPLGVHWHGLELESRFDGVPDWSGSAGSVTPPIPPGQSLVVRITPPRAGTFMYHVHSEAGHELAQGLYGAFLVLQPGESWRPDTDRLFVLGSLGAERFAPPAVNGRLEPEPIDLRIGVDYRLRFMHISPDDEKRVALLRDGAPVEWLQVAKDGADLPAALRQAVPASFAPHVGETYDFVWRPAGPGEYVLRIVTRFPVGAPAFPVGKVPPHTAEVRVRVR